MRTKRIMITALAEIIPYILIGVIGFFKINIMISRLGDDVNGYYQFINNLMSYLFLAEAGFTGAVIYKLYKPFSNNSKEEITSIFKGSVKIFRQIGAIIFVLILLTLPLIAFGFGIKSEYRVDSTLSFLIIGVSYLFPYVFYSNSFFAMFCANQRKYISSFIMNSLKLLCDLFIVLFVLKLNMNLTSLALIVFVIKVIEELSIYIMGKRFYPYVFNKKNKIVDTSAKEMSKDLFFHQLGFLIVNNVDVILIMRLIGGVYVSIYTSYNFIARFLGELSNRINNSLVHSFGNVFSSEKKDKSYLLFKEYLSFSVWFAFVVSLSFLIGIRTFINLWIGKDEYILNYFTAYAFALTLFLNIIYTPLTTIISSNGLFKESKYFVFIASFVNMVLSFLSLSLLGNQYKLAGTLIATSISYFITIILRTNLIKNKVFNSIKNANILKIFTKYTIFFSVFALVLYKLESIILNNTHSLISFLIIMGIIFIIISVLIFYMLLKSKIGIDNILNRFKSLLGGRNARKVK